MATEINEERLAAVISAAVTEALAGHDDKLLDKFERLISRKVAGLMTAIDDAKAALDSLVAEDALIVAGLDDLAGKVAAGTINEQDVNALKDGIVNEVQRLSDSLSTNDPDVQNPPQPPTPPDNPPVDPTA